MKNLLRGIIAAGLIGTPALAADIDPRSPAHVGAAVIYDWSGLFVGINGGGARGNKTGDLVSASGAGIQAGVQLGSVPMSFDAQHDGDFWGLQGGYNWQFKNLLVGIETDYQKANIGRTHSFIPFAPNPTITASARDNIEWFGTFRGRVGITVDRILFYGTAGAAYGSVKTEAANIFNPPNFVGSGAGTKLGWVGGAGIEWAFASNWSVKGEYLHLDLGSTNIVILDPNNLGNGSGIYRFNHATDTGRIGVNYRF